MDAAVRASGALGGMTSRTGAAGDRHTPPLHGRRTGSDPEGDDSRDEPEVKHASGPVAFGI